MILSLYSWLFHTIIQLSALNSFNSWLCVQARSGERETETETDRQTDRGGKLSPPPSLQSLQRQRQTDRQTDRQRRQIVPSSLPPIPTETETDRQTDRGGKLSPPSSLPPIPLLFSLQWRKESDNITLQSETFAHYIIQSTGKRKREKREHCLA